MLDVSATDSPMRAQSVYVSSFTALVDGDILTFEPTGAFGREFAADDDEVLWLVSVRDGRDDLREVARVRIAREALHSAIVDEYRFVMKWSRLPPDLRVLLHVATLASGSDDWYDMAAEKLGVTLAELAGWIEGEPPPEDLSSRLAVFVPRLRNEAFRMRIRAEQADMLLQFLDPSDGGTRTKSRDEASAARLANRRTTRAGHRLNNHH